MALATLRKEICPKCGKMTLTVWPAVGDMPGRKTCGNDRCQHKEIMRGE